MPPQVGKAGTGTGPVVVQNNAGVEEPRSTELKNKPVDKQKTNNNDTSEPYRATKKEASRTRCRGCVRFYELLKEWSDETGRIVTFRIR